MPRNGEGERKACEEESGAALADERYQERSVG
jgi:hypothetical protein